LIFGWQIHANIEKIENMCVPKITYFDKNVYNAANQTWAIAQNKKGYLYFANSAGLLEYDGSQWILYSLTNNSSMVRSIAITDDQRVYVGVQNEFGYWEEDIATRKLKYTSLTKESNLKFTDEEIWKIIPYHDAIYFHSFKNIYKYNVKAKTISIIPAPNRFQFLFKVNDRLFAQEKVLGLMELKDDRLVAIPGGEVLTGDCVYGMAPLSSHAILIATMDKGLYKMENERIDKCNMPCNDFLIRNQVFCMALLPDGRFAFGTILNGLVITDHLGNILSNINKPKGMPNNTVLSIFPDQNNNLWLGLDRGICHVQMSSPIRTFPDPKGVLGSVYQVKEYRGNLFFATNQGLFYCKLADFSTPEKELQFTLMPKTQGQAWALEQVGDKLYCGHNKGLYVVNGTTGDFVYTASGVSQLLNLDNAHVMFLTYDGMCVLHIQGSAYSVKRQAICPYNASYLAKDRNNYVYFGNNSVGFFRAKFDNDFNNVTYCSNQLSPIGISSKTAKGIFSYHDKMYLIDSKDGLMKFDYVKNRFVPAPEINKLLPPHADLYRLQIYEDEMWCYGAQQFFCIRDYDKPAAYLLSRNMESLYNQLLYRYENIQRIQTGSYLVCTSNSFAILNTMFPSKQKKKNMVYLRDIGVFANSMNSLTLDHDLAYYQEHQIEIPHNKNTVFIRFSLPDYENTGNIRYSYRLKGNSDNFSIPSASNIATFTNLPAGEYVFQVKATIVGTNEVYYSQELRIKILPPWYLGWIGVLLFLLLMAVIALVYYKYLQARWKKQQRRISLEHEKEMAHMENRLLQEKIKAQNDELSRVTKSMLHKNKLMNKLDAELQKLNSNKEIPSGDLKGLRQIVDKHKNPDEEWKVFEMSFNKTYDNYLVKLSTQFPGLTPADLKMAAYIRMNISSKEIAGLLNISLKSIEMARYRLRKKLNLQREQNLTEFLMGL
jgi:ligand-binding sensor domain-containing protein/DNA-binding CsgD family transcriptional regulator